MTGVYPTGKPRMPMNSCSAILQFSKSMETCSQATCPRNARKEQRKIGLGDDLGARAAPLRHAGRGRDVHLRTVFGERLGDEFIHPVHGAKPSREAGGRLPRSGAKGA